MNTEPDSSIDNDQITHAQEKKKSRFNLTHIVGLVFGIILLGNGIYATYMSRDKSAYIESHELRKLVQDQPEGKKYVRELEKLGVSEEEILEAFQDNLTYKNVGKDRYYNEEAGFSIKLPEGWDLAENKLGAVVMAREPIKNNEDIYQSTIAIGVTDLQEEMDTESFFNLNFDNLNKSTNNITVHEHGFFKNDGIEMKWLIATGGPLAVEIKTIQFYFVREKKGFIISCSSRQEVFNGYRLNFEQIAQSFKFSN